MMDIDESVWVPALITLLAVLSLGLFAALCGSLEMSKILKHEAIERGYAEYNQTTGAWQWKENPCND